MRVEIVGDTVSDTVGPRPYKGLEAGVKLEQGRDAREGFEQGNDSI